MRILAELKVKFEGKHYSIQIDRDLSYIYNDYHDPIALTMDKHYRLDTAVRMLIGVLNDAN